MSVTYIYNSSSVNLFSTEDYGLMSITPTSSIDNGSISTAHTSEENYFRVSYIGDVFPYGSINIGSSSNTGKINTYLYNSSWRFQFITTTTNPRTVHAWSGNGTLFEIGGGLERIVAPYLGADPITLFSFSGFSSESFGTRYTIEDVETLAFGDYGFVSTQAQGSSIDNGQVSEYTQSKVDYGVVPGNFSIPYEGEISITGFATNSKSYAPYNGSGSISISGVAAKVEASQAYEDTTLFSISGFITQKSTASHFGSGSLYISGTNSTPFSFRLQGPIRIEGSGKYRKSFKLPSSGGTLFGFSGSTDSVTKDYDLDNVLVFTAQDFGSVSSAASATIDYGSLDVYTATVDYGIFRYGNVNVYSTVGGYTLSGSAQTEYLLKATEIGSGSISIDVAAEYAFIPGFYATGLFGISGSASYNVYREFESFGSINLSGGDSYSTTRIFDINSGITVGSTDYGFISSAALTSEDNGLITQGGTSVDYGRTRLGSQPYGSITISGSVSNARPTRTYLQTGNASISITGFSTNKFDPGPWVVTGLFAITGSADVRKPHSFSGTSEISLQVSSDESLSRNYNDLLVNVYTTEDYGSVTSVYTSTEDRGALGGNYIRDDYGLLVRSQTEQAATGTLSISGAAVTVGVEQNIFVSSGGGLLFSIQGGDTSFIPGYIGSGSITVSGSPIYNFSLLNFGSGLITLSGDVIQEKITRDWNDSTFDVYTESDFGSLQASASTNNTIVDTAGTVDSLVNYSDDWGSVSQPVDDTVYNFGRVTTTQTLQAASGRLFAFGGGIEVYEPEFAWRGSGTIRLTGDSANSFFPTWNSFGSYYVSGGDQYAFSLLHIGSGSLFSHGITGEAVTKAYNLSAIDGFTSEDYGSVSSQPVSSSSTIVVQASDTTIIDATSLNNVTLVAGGTGVGSSGGFNIGEHLRFGQPGTTAFRSITTNPVDSRDWTSIDFEVIRGNSANGGEEPDPGENLVLFYETNQGNFVLIGTILQENSVVGVNSTTIRTLNIPVGARRLGTRFRILSTGTPSSSSAFDHYGLKEFTINIGSPASIDYEYVTDPHTDSIDLGTIFYGNQTNIPFGLFRIFGSADTSNPRRFPFSTTGTIRLLSGADWNWIPNWNTTGLFAITGSATTPYSLRNESSGSLFTIGGGEEKRIYDYNEFSISQWNAYDNGSVSSTATSTEDYGNIGDLPVSYESYGYVRVSQSTAFPYGSIKLSGSAIQVYEPEFAQIGTGLFSFTGVAISSFLPNWNGSGSIYLTGGDGYRFSLLQISTGSLFAIGGAAEVFVYDYNETSIDYFTNVDHGSISSTPTSTFDFGLVTDQGGDSVDYGRIFYGNQTNTPFGLFAISGSAITVGNRKPAYSGSGSLFTVGGAAESFSLGYPNTGLFRISGTALQTSILRNISTGSLFTIGGGEERRTYDYNEYSIAAFSAVDNGLVSSVATTSSDSGSITAISTNTVDSGYIRNDAVTGVPFGSIKLSGTVIDEYLPEFAQTGTGLFTISGNSINSFLPNWNGSGSIYLTGGDGYKFSLGYPGSGSLFSNGIGGEAITKAYNISSIDVFTNVDYGSVSTTATTTVDYGLVSSADGDSVDYGRIFYGNQTNVPFGLFRIGGAAITAGLRKPSYNASGLIRLFYSAVSRYAFIPNWNSTGLFGFSGSASTPYSLRHVSTGSLFTIGGGEEKRTYDYNEYSINQFSTTDYGQISIAATATQNYGEISDPVTNVVDNGYLRINSLTGVPFGSITVSGSAKTVYDPEFSQTGTGLFKITGQSSDKFIPNWNSSGGIILSGSPIYNFSLLQISVGSLFAIGGAAEAFAYDYNESSIDYFSVVNYGLISSTPTSTFDFGLVTDQGGDSVDYGRIFYGNQTNLPFGLFRIGGAAFTVGNRKPSYQGTGSLFSASGAAESKTSNPTESTVLFRYTGSVSPVLTFSQDANAFITVDIDSDERRTYDYNEFTIIPFSSEDNGLVSSAATSSEDYGSITDSDVSHENRGYIRYGSTVGSASGTITISGVAGKEFIAENAQVGSGSINLSGQSEAVFIPNWVATGLFAISGGDNYRFSLLHIGSGALFSNGISGEAVTKAYNISSVAVFSAEDYGSISTSATSTEDYGLITDSHTALYDYGRLTQLQTTYPFGLFTISGSAGEFFQPFRGQTSTGSIVISGTRSFEQFIPNWNSSGGIIISGSAGLVAYRNFPYTGTGALFSNGISGEAVTKSYNITSVVPFSTEDYGLISSTATVTTDYGYVFDEFGNFEDYGYIRKDAAFGIPYGTITISGNTLTNFIRAPYAAFGNYTIISNVQTPMQEAFGKRYDGFGVVYLGFASAFPVTRTRGYQGSGSLFTASGAAESKTTNKPESTVLFAVSGSAETPRTRPYIGSGSLFVLSGATEAVAVAPEATGLFTISGTADTDRTRDFVGSGSLFSVGGAAEAVAVAPETTGLFTISGSGDPPVITLKFVGGGTITVSGTVGESFTPATEIGSGSLFSFGGAAESKTSDEEFTGLYRFSGTAEPIIRTRGYQSSGGITISGTVTERQLDHYTGSGNIQITGIASAEESYAPASEQGSGSLFSFGGAAESKTSNPPENTILYTIGGQVTDIKLTYGYQTTGGITISGVAILKVILQFFGSGGITISGQVGESFTPATENGSGSITISGSASESFTKANYTGSGSYGGFSGSAVERQTDSYLGSGTTTISGVARLKIKIIITGGGSLFSTGGAAESKASNTPENIILYTFTGSGGESFTPATYIGSGQYGGFSGSAAESQTDDYVGTGSITLSGQATDIKLTYGHTGSGSLFVLSGAAESRTIDYENTVLFAISGSSGESFTPSVYDGSGFSRLSGSAVERQTDDYVGTGNITASGIAVIRQSDSYAGTGNITISGSVIERQSDDYVGTGSLFSTGGAAESKASNTPENTILFSFSGTAAESATFDEVSAGGTIVISGQATNVRFNRGWTGSGTWTISGSAVERQTDDYLGTGSLFAVSSTTESKTSNPPENIVLYRFSGTAGDQKLTFSESASGTITISGQSTTRLVINNISTGTIHVSGSANTSLSKDFVASGLVTIRIRSVFSGTTYAKVVDLPAFNTLYRVLGSSNIYRSRDYVGSGSLFAVGGAGESKTTNKPESTVLFRFSGAAETPRARDYVGTGSIFTVGGAAESRAVSPEATGLFVLSGSAGTPFSRAYFGSGSLFAFSGAAESRAISDDATGLFRISGQAETPRARDYVGTGSLFAIDGAAESITVVPEATGLFRISGVAGLKLLLQYYGAGTITISGNGGEAFVRPTYAGSGSFGGFGGSAEESKTSDEEFTGLTTISGQATDIKRTFGYRGTGRLLSFGGAAESKTTDYENTVLFNINGSATNRFIPGTYNGSGQIIISGSAITERRIFQPPFTFVTII